MKRSKGQIEAEISEAVVRFEKEYMGRGPLETKSYLVDDMVIVRLKGVLTQAEHQLVSSGDSGKGRELIKLVRVELLERGRPILQRDVEAITQREVRSLHTDISTRTGERVLVFSLDKAVDCRSEGGPKGT
ncbi:MAG TPA: DUF2294 domain-containing protein [Candidatus Hydrogenedentes bacterium]|nr:DUF2294 domain-containing protein [Candidatus Hydrogenedentota bacterium]HPG68886.1 DUF2294 domain-containing protein [Candidatus Hydrogenedentota bacterium]